MVHEELTVSLARMTSHQRSSVAWMIISSIEVAWSLVSTERRRPV